MHPKKCQTKLATFYSEVQRPKNKIGQLRLGIIVNEQLLTNLIINMPYKHFTPEQRKSYQFC